MFNFLVGLLAKLGGSFFGMLGGALGEVKNAVGEAAKEMLQYNQRAIAFGRQLGMSLKESQAYSEVLVSRAKDLGKAYGIAAEEVLKIQENLSNATGKALMLNDAQAETIVQINKLVGSNVYDQFTSEMMNGMGAQLGAVQGAVSKAYATAAKSGLNAAQFSEKVAKNLSMANRLSFKDGVNGIIRMTALSEKLGINMASVESAAKNFMDLDKAIENAAHMQMLGGSAAASFGNPLTAAYEANYDPEAFAKRMSDSLASYATFDANKGYASINGMNMDFVRNIAKAMGISEEDAVKNAKKQSEIKYKEGAFGTTLGQYNQQQRDFILNKSYVENGKLMINDASGNKHDISSGKLPENMLKEMMKFTNMDDSELMRQQALSLTSIDETVKGYKTSFTATIAEPIIKKAEEIQTAIKGWGDMAIQKIAIPLAGKLDKFLTMLTDENGILASLNNFAKSWTRGFFKLIISNLEWILGGVLAIKAFKFGKGAYDLGKTLLGKGGGSGGAAKAANGSGTLTKLGNIGKNVWTKLGPNASKAVKIGGGVVGGAIAIAQGASALTNYKTTQKDLNKALARGEINQETYNEQLDQARIAKNKAVGGAVGSGIGAALGSFFGPLGTAAGGVLGNWIGEKVGESWDTITEVASDAWEGTKKLARNVWDASKNFARGAWDASKNFAKGAWNVAKEVGAEVWNTISNVASEYWGAVSKVASDVWGGITTVASDVWKGIETYANGIWDGIGSVASGVWNSIETVGKTALDGISNIADKVSNAITKGYEGAKSVISDFYGGGKTVVKDVYEGVKTVVGDISGAIKGLFPSKNKKEEITSITNLYTNTTNVINGEKHANGGIVGGNSTNGDKVIARLNSGEMVLNSVQQADLFNFINRIPNMFGAISNITKTNNAYSNVTSYRANYNSDTFISNPSSISNMMTSMVSSILTNQNDVRTKPVGEKEYIYIPNRSEASNVNGNKITVNDFNINLSGTIRLDGGNNSKNVDVNALLNDFSFMNALKEMIKTSINNDMNGGRFMNDLATLRGQISSMSTYGR
jgi:hypothetical protein